jgi:hypothetical protein
VPEVYRRDSRHEEGCRGGDDGSITAGRPWLLLPSAEPICSQCGSQFANDFQEEIASPLIERFQVDVAVAERTPPVDPTGFEGLKTLFRKQLDLFGFCCFVFKTKGLGHKLV